MEYTLVALLVVYIVAGSTSHAHVVPYPQLIPYKVTYSDLHSPVLLSHHLGLSNKAILAAAGLQVAPAPVSEVAQEDIHGSINEPGSTSEAEITSPAPTYPALESTAAQSDNLSLAPLHVAVASANTSKTLGGANVNVNVHVNVNGDGTASIYNATSKSKIKAPIEDNIKLD